MTTTRRRKTYKIERIMNLGNGPETLPILETNSKTEFFEYQDEILTQRGVDSLVRATSRTATFCF